MHKDVEFREQRGGRIQASPIMAEAIINHLQIAHSPSIVTLSNAIGEPVTVEAQYSIFVDVGEVGLVD